MNSLKIVGLGKVTLFVSILAGGILTTTSATATSLPQPPPVEATLHEPGQPREDGSYLSKRAYQEGAAIVPYIVHLTAEETALMLPGKGGALPISLYGPSICLTHPVVLSPLDGSTSLGYDNAAWAQLLPERSGDRVIALNRNIGFSPEDPIWEISLESGDYYQSATGWVDSAVLGWIYSYGVLAQDFSWGGWYYLPRRGDVYIVDGGIQKVPHPSGDADCPDDEVSTYYLWDNAEQAWYFISAASPEWAYNFHFNVWMQTQTPHAVPDSDYIGLTEAEAIATAANDNDRNIRVVSRDGESLPVTTDYSPMRLNLSIEGGRVVSVTRG